MVILVNALYASTVDRNVLSFILKLAQRVYQIIIIYNKLAPQLFTIKINNDKDRTRV